MQDAVTAREGLVYVERESGPLALDLFTPVGDGPWPVIVFMHGGGWLAGSRTLTPDLRRYFCARGIAMAAISYRFSSVALFPAQLHDVRSAIRWLRENAEQFSLDPTGIAAWGASAGGHLAALAGLTSAVAVLPGETATDDDPSVAAVAESYGPTDLRGAAIPAPISLPGMESPERTPEGRLLGGDPADLPELATAASPLHQVTASAPAFQISHGTGDVLVSDEHSRRLYRALADVGVDVELYLVDDYQHGFLNPPARPGEPDPPVFDNGRLAAEGPASARRLRAHGGESHDERTEFGFDVIGEFFVKHLIKSPATATATSTSGDPR